jgi:PAS domain S-box-containing protein
MSAVPKNPPKTSGRADQDRELQDGGLPGTELRPAALQPIFPPHPETILSSVADGVFTIDANWHITFFNRAAEEITGIPAREALGRPCCEVFRASCCENSCIMKYTMETGKAVVSQHISFLRSDGKEVPISVSTALLRDRDGRIIGGVETFRDLSLVEKLRWNRFLAEDLKASGADLVLTGCSNCRDQILKNLKPKFNLEIEVKYLWEAVADALILEKARAAPREALIRPQQRHDVKSLGAMEGNL